MIILPYYSQPDCHHYHAQIILTITIIIIIIIFPTIIISIIIACLRLNPNHQSWRHAEAHQSRHDSPRVKAVHEHLIWISRVAELSEEVGWHADSLQAHPAAHADRTLDHSQGDRYPSASDQDLEWRQHHEGNRRLMTRPCATEIY
jgi:hypothetical protein